MENPDFRNRLAALRLGKGVSARDMSLSIGQSGSYINNIENGRSYPSMQVFFYICEYLGISPKEFFDEGLEAPTKMKELEIAIRGLSSTQIDHLIAIAGEMKR